MKHFILIIIASIFLFAGCEKLINPLYKGNSTFQLADTFEVAYHQTVYNQSENIAVNLNDVIGDSRCPIGLRCFWEGSAEIEFVFSIDIRDYKFSLNTFRGYTRDTTFADYNIKLINVNPYPHSEKTYSDTDYRASVVITKVK